MVDMRTREGRALRDMESREAEQHPEPWKPSSLLPDPHPKPGIKYRWIRVASQGRADPMNVSTRFREGWVPVPKEEVAYLNLMSDHKSQFPEGLEVGGLLLCQISEEKIAARAAYYEKMTQTQLRAADGNWMRQSDPRMPVSKPERSMQTTIGNGTVPR